MSRAAFLMIVWAKPFKGPVLCNRSAVLPLILTKILLALFRSETAFYSRRNKFGIAAACIVSPPDARPAIRGNATFRSFAESMIAPVIVAPIRHVLLLVY